MVNLEHKLTVDDLIIEYLMYKIENGYEPNFLTSEFVSFLYFFESEMKVEDVIYENEKLFNRFFERKNIQDWSHTNYTTREIEINPHMDMTYIEKENDYKISANYRFSVYDSSVINTYFMNTKEVEKVRNIIANYLSTQDLRKIDMSLQVTDKDLLMGKYITAEIIVNIWNNYVNEQIEKHAWPKQCKDINKYLLEVDLAEIIGLDSIKSDLFNFYDVISKRIAILYSQDRNLKISNRKKSYLAYSNYKLLIKDYEKTFSIAFGRNKSSLEIDLSELSFTEKHEINGVYFWDEDPDIKTTTTSIANDKAKKLVIDLEKNRNK